MEILLTGATGFVGSLLMPELLARGHRVRALVRDPRRLSSTAVEVHRGDVLSGAGLESALRGIEVAYYLIHSMEPSQGGDGFVERERLAASNFAIAARDAGVRRIVYLGGLVPRWEADARAPGRPPRPSSRHLASREEVERILLASVPDSVALRASIVIGARSRSFRLLVRLVERMPVLALPAWQRFRTQPIDERDVIGMLAACTERAPAGAVLEIGGPDVLSYGEMVQRIAEGMLVGRPAVRLGFNLTSLTGRVAAAIATESPDLVVPLMEGLQGDLLPREDHAEELLGIRLHSFQSALEHALADWERAEPLAAR